MTLNGSGILIILQPRHVGRRSAQRAGLSHICKVNRPFTYLVRNSEGRLRIETDMPVWASRDSFYTKSITAKN